MQYCISCSNYEILLFLIKEGTKIDDSIIWKAASNGNLLLTKYFLEENQISGNILVSSATSGNIELVKYILEKKVIDINAKDV